MSRAIKTLMISIAILATSITASFAQDFQKGLEAAQSGDFATALREWKPLAEQGDAMAQYNLGTMYDKGRGVAQDYKEAAKWYRKAAEQGLAEAQTSLGVFYSFGQGVIQNYAEAAYWYRSAAEQGVAQAQSNLGAMYANGEGVIQDNVYAHMWFNIAASNGNEYAVLNRDMVAKTMTASQIAEAQKLARECVQKNYKGC